MILPVVLLPDTALLVPGVAGRADPLADLRDAAVVALRETAWAGATSPGTAGPGIAGSGIAGSGTAEVLVIAPGSRDRDLRGARGSLTAAGVPTALVPEVGPADGPRCDVPASVALHLLHAAGLPLGDVRVVEIARSRPASLLAVPAGPAAPAVLAGPGVDLPALPSLVVVVGSPSARDGEDAPLAADPAAAALDEALIAALGAGPAALAAVLDGRADLTALAVSGAGPWSALTALLARHGLLLDPDPDPDPGAAQVLAATRGTPLGTHVVARWLIPIPDIAQEPR